MNSIKKIIITVVLLWPATLLAQTRFYVSLKGNDANRGTQIKPFASIGRGLLEVRKTAGPVVIYLLEGTYYLKQPVVFTPEDSRRNNETLTITSGRNQKIIISGGVALNLKWEKYKNGTWKAAITQDLIFDELFVNGQLQRMARYPNFDSTARFLGGTAADAVSKERTSRWRSPAGGYVHALHRSEWGDFHYLIKGKNDQNELVLEGGWQNNRRMGMHEKHRFV
ncbi:MAG: peptide-binding protein, partial [Flavitalea sp.]